MPEEIRISDLKLLSAKQLRDGQKSYVVIADGAILGVLLIPQTDYILQHGKELAVLSNSVHGK